MQSMQGIMNPRDPDSPNLRLVMEAKYIEEVMKYTPKPHPLTFGEPGSRGRIEYSWRFQSEKTIIELGDFSK